MLVLQHESKIALNGSVFTFESIDTLVQICNLFKQQETACFVFCCSKNGVIRSEKTLAQLFIVVSIEIISTFMNQWQLLVYIL